MPGHASAAQHEILEEPEEGVQPILHNANICYGLLTTKMMSWDVKIHIKNAQAVYVLSRSKRKQAGAPLSTLPG